MTRKLFLLIVMALSALALSASPAGATGEVVVEEPGMYELEAELTMAIVSHVSPTTEVPSIRCEVTTEAQVNANGSVNLHDVNIDPHSGQTGNCADGDDCGNAGWSGQIEELEPSDPAAFELHLTFCLSGTASSLDGLPISVECAATVVEGHCDYVIVPGAGTPSSPRVELQGEFTVHP